MSVELISVLVAVLAIGASFGRADPDQQSRVAAGHARGHRSVVRGHQRLAGRSGRTPRAAMSDTGKDGVDGLREDTSQLRDDIKAS